MEYRIDIHDASGRRVASFDEVPLLEAVRSLPDDADIVRGLLPSSTESLSHGYSVRVFVDGRLFCEGAVCRVEPQWSDTRKLILDRYVSFHEIVAFEAERPAWDGNTRVSHAYTNRGIASIAKSVINSALGRIHYTVKHEGYPEGAAREYAKFLSRRTSANELAVGGIETGQWAGAGRINAGGAYAKDGDTIAGLVVDGVPWPDLRLMMIDAEETSRNSHAVLRHPEVAGWTDDEYSAGVYGRAGIASRNALQALIDANGIDFIELNPHRDASGAFDDRVDAYGRYLGFVYGNGLCFNAAQVENGHAEVYLWEDGRFHVPEMELKDYFSYTGLHKDSIETIPATLLEADVDGGVLEVLTALAYAAQGCVWSLDPEGTVWFRRAEDLDRVVFFDMRKTGVALGSDSKNMTNVVYFEGNPRETPIEKSYWREESANEYGSHPKRFVYYSIRLAEDADRLVEGLLDDVAYPEPCGFVQFHAGDSSIHVGDLVELRDGPIRRLDRVLDGAWGGHFAGRHVGRIRRVSHRFSGKEVTTTAWFTSPLRSVSNPLSAIVRGQASAESLYQFRLDEETVGVDAGYHLD